MASDAAARWRHFAAAAPALAVLAAERFSRYEVVYLATNGRAGFPRISLVEPLVVAGDLVIATDESDRKTGDLRADPRCAIHCPVPHRAHEEGELKARAVAVPIDDRRLPSLLAAAARPEIGWRPTAAFELRVQVVVFQRAGAIQRWTAEDAHG